MITQKLSPDGAPAIYVDTPPGQLCLTFLQPDIVRVRLAGGNFSPRRSWAVPPPDHAFSGTDLEVFSDPSTLRVAAASGGLTANLDPATGRLSFTDGQKRNFCSDAEPPKADSSGVQCVKEVADSEHFYGFGERTGIQLERSGRWMHNWTTDPAQMHSTGVDPMYKAIPVYLAVRPGGPAYGLYFNNTWRSSFDLRMPGQLMYQAEAGELDYYLVYGPTPSEVTEKFAALLGHMPLPPRWSLGYHQSRWSYTPDQEVRRIAAELRRRKLPCDVLHLDIDYMDGYRVFTWDKERFPNPARLAADLRAQGFRLVSIIDPGVKSDPDYAVYRSGLEQDYFIRDASRQVVHRYVWPDDSVFPDFSRPEVRAWWGELQRTLTDSGIAGIWNDMNEPVVFSLPFSQGGGSVGSLPVDCPQGPPDERTTHAEVHNLYGSGMAQASYEGLLKLRPEDRPFNLCRSGFAGIQRWTASWMGDNASSWEHLEMSLPQLMNMGLSGTPFVGVDIGGFTDHATPELFARWIEAGILYPFCRGHSAIGTIQQQPWDFGEQVEAIARKYLELRYRLLPYLYTLFYQAHTTGQPILRPLLYHFPDDPAVFHLHDQAMLGPSLMAAPIVQPGRHARSVYLPAGVWYDYWTSERLEGAGTILAPAPLDHLPLYVRAGAALPLGPLMAYTDEKPLDPLTLEVYPGNGQFDLYEDDGHSFAYQHGEFTVTQLAVSLEDSRLVVSVGPRQGRYQPDPRRIIVRVHRGGSQPPVEETFEDTGAFQRLYFDL